VKFFELQIDFFVPLWRRLAVVWVCVIWAMVEFGTGAPFWGIIFSSLSVYAIWQFFLSGWPATDNILNPPSKEAD
jgi:hypothetical protein